jgi:hypothetical protein
VPTRGGQGARRATPGASHQASPERSLVCASEAMGSMTWIARTTKSVRRGPLAIKLARYVSRDGLARSIALRSMFRSKQRWCTPLPTAFFTCPRSRLTVTCRRRFAFIASSTGSVGPRRGDKGHSSIRHWADCSAATAAGKAFRINPIRTIGYRRSRLIRCFQELGSVCPVAMRRVFC